VSEVALITQLPRLIDESPVKARLAVEKTCAVVVQKAMGHSRVDTGLMRSEWKFDMDDTKAEGTVFNLVRYAVYNEYGTRYMSAHPMLRPAIAEARDEFEAFVAEIYAL
jgi:hypothetical protein